MKIRHQYIRREKRKRLVYLRKTLEQKQKEVCIFTSFCFCEMAEKVGAGAGHYEMRKGLTALTEVGVK
jgi:UDP:flavonoid glycosyltransferase YjiC (YdhE family)